MAGQWQGSLGPCTPSKAKAIDQYMRKTTFKNILRMKYKFSTMWFFI